ncbi:nucleoside triphosphate pyrophosphohydrolase [Curvivirga aplysinae]|uniref:nucleoside triphosphate pyrophosphohydrolase n=1 Tax=Curvivirga aplysinae TaxID=2529852 RepID=UPI0012BD114F|nr:nucleoside triphosphate pyrophosphohydrolase [Curvivirga aplysinae]MTI10053.1 nucleoside triphosphate pyrophosphohydrolase [Curvivirga aplysinae]
MSDSNIDKLLEIMAALRTPETGCPWDLEQNFETIAPYTVEEAYEVADAIERNDMNDLKDELGDLLLQVVFHSRMAEEENLFTFNDVAGIISNKMIRRHPHVFGDHNADTSDAVKQSWEDTKAAERKEKGQNDSALDGVAMSLPALLRAEKLTKRAARVNFDWPSYKDVFSKIREEIDELEVEIDQHAPIERIEDELGDLLFCMANLARHFKLDPEITLKKANNKFTRRFKAMEKSFKDEDKDLSAQSLEDMEDLAVG